MLCVMAGHSLIPHTHPPPTHTRTTTHTQQAEKTGRKAQLAERLINGLSGENARWGAEIKRMESVEGRLVGDVMMAAAFVSYAGPFNMFFRKQLVDEKWLPDLIERQIPMSQGIKPLDMLTK